MIRKRHTLSRRALIGLALGLWVILISCIALRAQSAGTQWGLQARVTNDGRVVATSVDRHDIAFIDGLRDSDELTSIDGQDPALFTDRPISSSVREVVFLDDQGVSQTVHVDEMPASTLALLLGGALLFVILGGVVHRWSADAALGRLFLFFASAFATTLAAAPAARLGGDPFATFMTTAAALVAGPSLLVLFMMF